MDPRPGTFVSPPAALRIAEQQYDSPFIGESLDLVMDALPSGLVYIDAALRIQHCNRRSADWLGESAGALRGRHAASALGAQGWRAFEPHLRRTLNGEHSTCKHMLATPDHGDLTLEATCIPDRNAQGHVRGVFVVLDDATVRRRRRIESVALHVAPDQQEEDVPGPQRLADHLCDALAARRGDGQRLALLWLGLDGARPMAGAGGQPVGDRVVQNIARRIASCVRKSDFVARIGADEIAVLIPRMADFQDLPRVAEKVQAVCELAVEIGGCHLRPLVRVGMAVYPDNATDSAGILAAAEASLARARHTEPCAVLT